MSLPQIPYKRTAKFTVGSIYCAHYASGPPILQRLRCMSYAGLVGSCISLAIGGTGGSIVAGIFSDIGMLTAAIIFPALSLLLVATIYSGIYGLCTAPGVTADTGQKSVNGVFLTAGLYK